MNQPLSLSKSKPHYEILDGLRGVAAILVVLFHLLEVYAHGDFTKQIINHGYLAVDFFFMLSGFVISYAYDDRWNVMTVKDFFIRRVIRLQPMIIFGMVIGAILYYFQDSVGMGWDIKDVPVWKMLLVMFIGCTLFPVGKSLDIRGWSEMHPLNGAAWSLFYEYVANIIYGLFLRRVSKVVLSLLVLIAAGATIHYALTNPNGNFIGGWSIDATQLRIGFTRLTFPFLAGMLLAKVARLIEVKQAFLICSILLVVLFSVPHLGSMDQKWINGLYECFCLIVMFPFIVWLGAGGKIESAFGKKICKFLGDISYPLYITHLPFVLIYMAWVTDNNLTLEQGSWMGALVFVVVIIVAYASMKFYDIPIREFLRKKFITKNKK